MDVYNFQLSNVFHDSAKKYVTKPVMAAKYQPGIENGWMVYFKNKFIYGEKDKSYFGIKFFPTKDEAQSFINAHEKQYAMENGKLIERVAEYDNPVPVLYREEQDIENNNGLLFQFGDNAFVSDESERYEFYILYDDTWIIQDIIDGNIRVWNRTMEDLFFGNESEYVYEKTDKGEYLRVAV